MRPYLLNALVVLAGLSYVHALWPIPRSLETGSTFLKLSNEFKITVNVPHAPSDLFDAVSRTSGHLKNDRLQRLVVGRGSVDNTAIQQAKEVSELTLTVTAGSPVRSIQDEVLLPLGSRSEEYTLHVPADGSSASISANSTLGLLRGLTTFEQLWYFSNGQTYTFEAPIAITDSPAYPYRGFMLDTSRNFFPVPDIKRTLDAMSSVKMSQFHWHVVDSHSFPLVVPGFTEVAEKGAYSSSEIYSPSDVRDIVSYAGARGIDVLVEIDNPGHTAIISESHPDLIACNEASPWAQFANEPPAGQLRFASPTVATFASELLTAVAKMFPSKFFSTGGDELNINCYGNDLETQDILQSTGQSLEQALDNFTRTTHSALQQLGKTPVVWEEMVLEHNVTLSNETIVMVWISSEHAKAITEKNFKIVHGPSDFFYLDCGAGGWVGDFPVGNSWCDPFKTWQKAYTFDPLANISTENTHLVLGGQQLLWTEQSDPSNLDSIVWPRAASSAEVFWTGATLPDGSPRNVSSALPRLHDLRFRLVQRGVKAIALQPLWCALRPGQCDIDA